MVVKSLVSVQKHILLGYFLLLPNYIVNKYNSKVSYGWVIHGCTHVKTVPLTDTGAKAPIVLAVFSLYDNVAPFCQEQPSMVFISTLSLQHPVSATIFSASLSHIILKSNETILKYPTTFILSFAPHPTQFSTSNINAQMNIRFNFNFAQNIISDRTNLIWDLLSEHSLN